MILRGQYRLYLFVEIIGENVFEQRKIDTILKENGNEQTSFAISLAVARAAAAAEKIPLYRYLGGVRAVHPSMPQLIRKEEIEIEKIKEIEKDLDKGFDYRKITVRGK